MVDGQCSLHRDRPAFCPRRGGEALTRRTITGRGPHREDLPLELLGVLASPARIELLGQLSASPQDVSSLAEKLDLEIDHVSHHLAKLRDRGLVTFMRDGKRHIYELTGAVRMGVCQERMCLVVSCADLGEIIISMPRVVDGPYRDSLPEVTFDRQTIERWGKPADRPRDHPALRPGLRLHHPDRERSAAEDPVPEGAPQTGQRPSSR
jgi:DNA-binding transcriptional ArsR family regulator